MSNKQSTRGRLIPGAVVVLSLLNPALLSPALSDPALSDLAASAQSERVIEEITVTATKREQSVQDVPVSIGVVTGELIQAFDIRDMSDLQNFVPGLQVQQTFGTWAVRVRGLGSGITNLAFDSSVPVYRRCVLWPRQMHGVCVPRYGSCRSGSGAAGRPVWQKHYRRRAERNHGPPDGGIRRPDPSWR